MKNNLDFIMITIYNIWIGTYMNGKINFTS